MVDLLDDDILDLEKKTTTDPKEVADELRRRHQEAPESNSALREWQAPEPVEGSGSRRCVQCNRAVSSKDHWVMLGLCKQCLAQDRMDARDRLGEVDPHDWLSS